MMRACRLSLQFLKSSFTQPNVMAVSTALKSPSARCSKQQQGTAHHLSFHYPSQQRLHSKGP